MDSGVSDECWPRTLPEALLRQVERRPDSPAFVYLGDGAEPVARLTYREVDAAARGQAADLAGRGLAGQNVIMLFGAVPAFVTTLLGCAYAGVVGIPLQIPRSAEALRRVLRICRDAGTTTVLTTSDVREEVLGRFPDAPELGDLTWVEAGGAGPDAEWAHAEWADRGVDPETPAILQYTSGSTGNPKGVVISHRNFAMQAAELDELWPLGDDGAVVSWLPTFHDMGLLFGVIVPLWTGSPSYLMAPELFVRRPANWLEAISRFRGTHTASPDFGYELCVRRIRDDAARGLDLSSWRVAVSGAERVRWGTLQKFTAAFSPYGLSPQTLCPGYGLAENTLKVSGSAPDAAPKVLWASASALRDHRVEARDEGDPATVPLVSCGRVPSSTSVRIVRPRSRAECAPGEVGEIWVDGPCVSRGYWRRPLENQETFQARIVGDHAAGPFLRTGDLGFLHEDELYIVGRLKDLLIFHGANYHPEDIEHTAEAGAPQMRLSSAAAFSVETPDAAEQLVVALEVAGGAQELAPPELADAVIRAVNTEYQLPVGDLVLVSRGSLPKTTSGKIRRSACREAYLAGALSAVWQHGRLVPQTGRTGAGSDSATVEETTGPAPVGDVLGALRDRAATGAGVASVDEHGRVPAGALGALGDAGSGAGAAHAAQLWDWLTTGAVCTDLMKRALQSLTEDGERAGGALETVRGDRVARLRVSSAVAATGAAEALVHGIAAMLDKDEDVPDELFMTCKVVVPELLREVADTVSSIVGGIADGGAPPPWARDAEALRLGDGSTDFLLTRLGSSLADGGQEVEKLLADRCDGADLSAELALLVAPALAADRIATAGADAAPSADLAYHALGGAVAATLVVGMLRRAVDEDPGAAHSLLWAEDRRRDVCRAAREGLTGLTVLMNADSLIAKIGTWPVAVVPAAAPATASEPASESVPVPSADDAGEHPRRWVIEWVAVFAGIAAPDVDSTRTFLQYGLDSVALLTLGADFEQRYSFSPDAAMFWDYPTIGELADALSAKVRPGIEAEIAAETAAEISQS